MDDEFLPDEPKTLDSSAGGIPTVWKISVVVVALIIIGIFAYPFLTQAPSESETGTEAGAASPAEESEGNEAEADAPDPLAGATSAEELFQRGNSFVQSGQLENAVIAYEAAIEQDDSYQSAYANLGVVYYQLGQLDEAAQQYERALELNPSDGDVAYNLGALRLQQALSSGSAPDQARLEEAIDQLQRALELSPDLAEPHFSLGVAYASLERPDEAIQAFERFLEQDSGQDPRASQEAQRYLDTLKAQ